MHLTVNTSRLVAWAFALLLTSCHDEDAQGKEAVPVESDALFSYETVCAGTGGVWTPGLLACTCGTSEVFSARNGCVDIRDVTSVREGSCFVGDVLISGMGDSEPCSGQHARVTADALRGWTIEGPKAFDDAAIVRLRPLSAKSIEDDIQRGDYELLGSFITTNHNPQAVGIANAADVMSACVTLTSGLHVTSTGDICAQMARAVSLPLSRDFQHRKFADKFIVPGEPAVEMAMAKLGADHGGAVFRVVGVAGMPLMRSIVLRRGEDLRIDVLLSPSGTIVGGRIEEYYAATDSNSLLSKETTYFDAKLSSLAAKRSSHGNAEEIYAALEARLEGTADSLVGTDGVRQTNRSVRAMIVEGAVDPRFTDLFRRVRVDTDRLRDWLASGSHPGLFASPGTADIDGLLDVVVSDPDGDDMHGTQVASVLADGLLSEFISLFPLRMGGWLTDLGEGRERLIAAIRRENPQVVNLSLSFAPAVEDCDEFFGPIFREFEDETLFVVAAGNDGARNAGTVCPAQLSRVYPNVVAVAGTDDGGDLHRLSNYGRDTVQVAAPYCHDVIFDPGKPEALKQVCGTSFAAPFVGNAVLHALAERPHLSPRTLKRLLMLSCEGEELDVECGAAVNVNKFLELVEEW